MRTTLGTSFVLSLCAVNALAQGGTLKSLEEEAITFLGEVLSQDYTALVSELAGVVASDVPPSAVISDFPALVSAVQPQLSAYESELAAFFTGELASVAAPSAIISAAPAIATDLIEDAVSALKEGITAGFPATMAITAVPAALATDEAEVLSRLPEVAEEIFSELGPDIAPISKQLASWLPGAITAWEGTAGVNATTAGNAGSSATAASSVRTSVTKGTATSGSPAAASSSSVVQASGGDPARSLAGGMMGVFAFLAIVVSL